MFERITTIVGLLAIVAAVGMYAIPHLLPGDAPGVMGLDLARIIDEQSRLDLKPLPVPAEDREICAALARATADNAGEGIERMRRHLAELGETALRRAALGWMLLLDQQGEAARKELARALELDPDSPYALVATGYDHLRYGRFEPAAARLGQALGKYAGSADWQRLYTAALLATGKLEQALAAAERAVALDPNTPSSYLLVGDVHLRGGRLSEALRWYEAACELAGPDSEITRNHQPVLEAMRERLGS